MVLNPQFIEDSSGKKLVVLHQEEFDQLIAQFEDLEDIRLYRTVKKNDTGDRIPIDQAFEAIETEREFG